MPSWVSVKGRFQRGEMACAEASEHGCSRGGLKHLGPFHCAGWDAVCLHEKGVNLDFSASAHPL